MSASGLAGAVAPALSAIPGVGPVLGIVGTALGALGGPLASLLGSKKGKQKPPQMAPITDFSREVGRSYDTNWQYLPMMQQQSASVNQFNQGQINSLMEQAMPGIGRVREQLMGQLQEDLTTKGLPKSVEDNLRRKAAEMGVSRGTQGGFNQFKLLQDFGFNMIDWERARRAQALQTLSTIQGISPRANPMSPQSMFVSPQQSLATAESNREHLQSYYNTVAKVSNANRAARSQMMSGLLGAGLGLAGQGASALGSAVNSYNTTQNAASQNQLTLTSMI